MSSSKRFALCALSLLSIVGCAAPVEVESSSDEAESVAVGQQPLLIAASTSRGQPALPSPIVYRPTCAVLADAYSPPAPGQYAGNYLGAYVARYEVFTPGATDSGAIYGSHAQWAFRSYAAAAAGDWSELALVQVCDFRPTIIR
jgi:hypothetical protein